MKQCTIRVVIRGGLYFTLSLLMLAVCVSACMVRQPSGISDQIPYMRIHYLVEGRDTTFDDWYRARPLDQKHLSISLFRLDSGRAHYVIERDIYSPFELYADVYSDTSFFTQGEEYYLKNEDVDLYYPGYSGLELNNGYFSFQLYPKDKVAYAASFNLSFVERKTERAFHIEGSIEVSNSYVQNPYSIDRLYGSLIH